MSSTPPDEAAQANPPSEPAPASPPPPPAVPATPAAAPPPPAAAPLPATAAPLPAPAAPVAPQPTGTFVPPPPPPPGPAFDASALPVGTDVMTQDELTHLGGLRSRWAARRQMSQRKGAQGAKLMSQLQREQINLAMIRSRSGSDDYPSVVAQRERIRTVRGQLDALPDVVAPVPVVTPAAAGTAATAAAPAGGAATAPPAPSGAWAPTHAVPATGMAAWEAPDPSRPPTVMLAGGVQLVIAEEIGAWARVVGSNGWTGWVDRRLLARL